MNSLSSVARQSVVVSDSCETFRNSQGRYMVPGLLGLLLLPPSLLSFLNFDIVPMAFLGGFLVFLALVASVMGRTRLELSSSGIRYRVVRTRIVAWEKVVGARLVPFGELQIIPSKGNLIRIGSLKGRKRIEEITSGVLKKPLYYAPPVSYRIGCLMGRQDRETPDASAESISSWAPSILRIGPAEWLARVIVPLIVILTVIGMNTALAVAVALSW